MNPTGTCALCKTASVVLIESHVVPNWVYRRILAYDPRSGGQGVAIIRGRAGLSGKQAKTYLLCRPCEDLLGVSEDYVARCSLQDDRVTFPLLAAAVSLRSGFGMHLLDLKGADANHLTRFAVGVFWRADVAQSDPIVNLGSAREHIRAYLVGGSLPQEVDVVVNLLRPPAGSPPIDRVLVYPATEDGAGRQHEFVACGLRFTLLTTFPHIPEASLPRMCRGAVSPGHGVTDGVVEKAQASTAYGKLARRRGTT
jgi:hypothetical protein